MPRTRFVCLVTGFAACCLLIGWGGSTSAAETDPLKLLRDCQAACGKIKDFAAVFTKEEVVQGEPRKPETVKMKLRAQPFSVYMHWFQDPHKGREVIYVKGKYDGKIVGHQPVGPLDFSKRSAPDSPSLKKESRRPITHAGFRNAIEDIIQTTELGRKNNEVDIRYVGEEVFNERPVHVIHRVFTQDRREYPVHFGVVYLDKERLIPVKIAGYDRQGAPLGIYTYTDVRLNIGLGDSDFDIRNSIYNFPSVLPFAKIKLPWPFGGSKT